MGYWKNVDDVLENWALSKTFVPQIEEEEREKILKGWTRAVRGALAWADEKY